MVMSMLRESEVHMINLYFFFASPRKKKVFIRLTAI
jgi:hypothetical protein